MKAPSESVSEAELAGLRYPLLASFKLDGLRAVHSGGMLLTRKLKPFPNEFLNKAFVGLSLRAAVAASCLDGELVVGLPHGEDVLQRAQSGLKSRAGEPNWTWWVFDSFLKPTLPFWQRHGSLQGQTSKLPLALRQRVRVLPHVSCASPADVLELEAEALAAGYEGLMLRDPEGPYKDGRCTKREGWLLKMKRFEDSEALVTAVEEGTTNLNEAVRQADGSLKRSTAKSGKVGSGLLGTLVGTDVATGATVRINPGKMTADEKRRYAAMPELVLGKLAKYKRPAGTTSDAGRYNVFQAFRDPSDM